MNKLREGTTTTSNLSSTPPPIPVLASASSTASLAMNTQTRRVTLDNRSKNMAKSRSTQNLILPTTTQPLKPTALRRVKISRVSRRPPNLPTATINQSSTSSSSSSNTSSPTKTNQTKENDQTKQYIHPSSLSQESVLPLRQLDNTTNDLMPKWAQDCFYRTVVLGLKPLLLQDIPGSPSRPVKRSSSRCSLESSDSLEATNELQACTLNDSQNVKETPVRRSISIPDYRKIKQGLKLLPPSLSENTMNDAKEE